MYYRSDLLQKIAGAAGAPRLPPAGQRHWRDRRGGVGPGAAVGVSKAFAIIGRTLGAMAHIGEEIRNPMAQQIDAASHSVLVYELDEKEKP